MVGDAGAGMTQNTMPSNAADEAEPPDELQPPRSIVASCVVVERRRGWTAVEMGAEPVVTGDEGPLTTGEAPPTSGVDSTLEPSDAAETQEASPFFAAPSMSLPPRRWPGAPHRPRGLWLASAALALLLVAASTLLLLAGALPSPFGLGQA